MPVIKAIGMSSSGKGFHEILLFICKYMIKYRYENRYDP